MRASKEDRRLWSPDPRAKADLAHLKEVCEKDLNEKVSKNVLIRRAVSAYREIVDSLFTKDGFLGVERLRLRMAAEGRNCDLPSSPETSTPNMKGTYD